MVSPSQILQALREAWVNADWVRRHRGVSLARQMSEILRLRRYGVRLSTYYFYGLFDSDRFPDFATKATYRNWTCKDEFRRFSDPRLHAVAYHKHIFYRLAQSFDVPVPAIRALYSPRPDGFERHRALTSPEQLADYLATTDEWPLFGKPSNASHGYGALGMLERRADGRILLSTGRESSIEDVVRQIHGYAEATGTYLLCECLEQREDIRRLTGDTVASIRAVVMLRAGRPELLSTTMLLPREKAHVSNVRGLTTGGLSCKIDFATGTITEAISSAGPDTVFETHHPDTGAEVVGHRLDGWSELTAAVLDAARTMSPFRLQHWDAALTTRGPVFLEMNFIGDLEALQLHGPPGLYSEEYTSFAANEKVW